MTRRLSVLAALRESSSLWLASSSGRTVAPAAAVQPPDSSNRSAPRWSSIKSPGLSRSCRRNRLIMRVLMQRERCAARRSGQRPGQRSSGSRRLYPPARRRNPHQYRGSPSGASRTRTGGLLGAIQAVPSDEFALFAGNSSIAAETLRVQDLPAVCGGSREFHHAEGAE
jgi:hypothetical protein